MSQPNESGAEVRCPKCQTPQSLQGLPFCPYCGYRLPCKKDYRPETTPEPASEAVEGKARRVICPPCSECGEQSAHREQCSIGYREFLNYKVEALHAQVGQLKGELSSGICSAHREPDPLNCDLCNKVKVLEGASLTRIETIDQLRADGLRLEKERKQAEADQGEALKRAQMWHDRRKASEIERDQFRDDLAAARKELEELEARHSSLLCFGQDVHGECKQLRTDLEASRKERQSLFTYTEQLRQRQQQIKELAGQIDRYTITGDSIARAITRLAQ